MTEYIKEVTSFTGNKSSMLDNNQTLTTRQQSESECPFYSYLSRACKASFRFRREGFFPVCFGFFFSLFYSISNWAHVFNLRGCYLGPPSSRQTSYSAVRCSAICSKPSSSRPSDAMAGAPEK